MIVKPLEKVCGTKNTEDLLLEETGLEERAKIVYKELCESISHNADTEFDIKNVIEKCIQGINTQKSNTGKYLITPYDEQNEENTAELTPLEELTLLNLFKKGDGADYKKITVLLKNGKSIIEREGTNIYISFEKKQQSFDVPIHEQ